jgi:hypothetical protein|tara:strand:+ start:1042 stop:1407 length:366 start_codon:yes stop_codon:yes gene_type:complete
MDLIHGPVEGHGHAGVSDVVSYIAIHEQRMAKVDKKPFEVSDPVHAYINHGRWVIDCECNGGGLTSPTFKLSCCFDCGRRYVNVVFPKNAKKIERELLKRRDQSNRNWHGESLRLLAKEKG